MSKLSKKVIGLTGNIACGKSTCVDYLISLNYQVIDTDLITQDIYNNSDYFKQELIKLFNEDIIKDGIINKKMIGNLVFNNPELLQALNSLIHPLIKKETIKQIDNASSLVFVDVPLLYEAKFDDLVDLVILVYLDEQLQLNRLMKRDNIDRQAALLRINSQMSQTIKKEKANYLVDNSFSKQETYLQIDEILKKLKEE